MAVSNLVSRSGVVYKIKVNTLKFDLTGISGTFEYLETVTGGTSSATATVVYFDSTNSDLFVFQTASDSGTFVDTETVTGGTSGATGTISGAPATAWMTDFVTLVRLRDTVSTNRTRPVQEIVDFDSSEEDFTDKITGAQSGQVSATSNIVISDASYQLAEASYEYNLDSRIERTRTTRDAANSQVRTYEGVMSQFNETDNVNDVSTVAWNFEISDVL